MTVQDNLVPCAWCGRILYRTAYRRARSKHSFCSIYCYAEYCRAKAKANKMQYTNSVKNYRQTAWLVSKNIAKALQTGTWPK